MVRLEILYFYQVKSSKEATALLDGDEAGIDLIYQNYYPRIEAAMKKWNTPRQVIRDLFQDALMVIYQKLKTPDFKLTSSFYTFLYAVCFNLLRDERKKKRNTEVTLDEGILSIDEGNIERDIHAAQQRAFFQSKFKLLKDDCQKLLEYYFGGLSMREIGEKLNTSEGYIRKKKHGCKQKLMTMIEADPLFAELKNK